MSDLRGTSTNPSPSGQRSAPENADDKLIDVQHRTKPQTTQRDDVIRYFEVAGPDYAAWSKQYNMHFGLCERGMNPFRREPMLDRMNLAALTCLKAPSERPTSLADMGCGLGATARFIARLRPQARITGVTIVPWQVATGNRMSAEQALDSRVEIVLSDFAHTPLSPASMDGAYAIESSCYATGPDKADLIAEMARIVKPGGRVVISDGFRKDSRPFGPLLRRVYGVACRSWAIREMGVIGPFVNALEAHGFVDVDVQELSWQVAPSFAHVPFLCVWFALQRLARGDFVWPKERWQNLMGPLFGSLLGLCRSRFGYFHVTASRDGSL